MWLSFYRLRFHFTAQQPIRFGSNFASNTLRGGLGLTLRRIACVDTCPGVSACEYRHACAYARLFEPVLEDAPSGFAAPPRPLVFRAAHLDRALLPESASFHFDVHLFALDETSIPYLVAAFLELGRDGLGPRRGRAELTHVDHLDLTGLATARFPEDRPPLTLSLEPDSEPVTRIQVQFITPTELKSDGEIAAQPTFGILLKRIRDRIGALTPLEMDFTAFGDRAAKVRMTRCELRATQAVRHSTRTGQWHPLGGFTGVAEYEGDLAEFIPFLRAARFTGAGRQTTWGKGEIAVRVL